MVSRTSRLIAAALIGTSLLAVGACSSDGKSSSADAASAATNAAPAATTAAPATVAPQASATTAAPAPTAAATVPAAASSDTTPPAEAGGKVNINEASVPDLETTFKAVGVTNAHRWALEVDEYRPYPRDPDFAKLRQELGKYNIDPAILELIISTLEF